MKRGRGCKSMRLRGRIMYKRPKIWSCAQGPRNVTTLVPLVVCTFWHKDYENIKIQEVLWRTNRLLSLIRHRPNWKRPIEQVFYCCVCIRYRGNASTEPLPSNDRGIFTEPTRYLGTIGGYTYRHTDWWEGLFNRPLRWAQVPWCTSTYQVSKILVQAFKR
jgi:hypothetical protein